MHKQLRDDVSFVELLILQTAALSLMLFGLKSGLLCFAARTDFSDRMASMTAMALLACAGLLLAKRKKLPLAVFPARFSAAYIFVTLASALLVALSPEVRSGTVRSVLLTLYGCVVTPVFEELFFRGYLWERLRLRFQHEWAVCLLTALLFGLWHLGYAGSLAFRVQEGLSNALLWKVVTGLCYGAVLGCLRVRTRNCFSTMLLHGVLNLFAR